MAKYPYAFTLRIGYHIEENKLEVLWQVENPSEEELPFSIGGHPAFNRPKNCKIRFDVARLQVQRLWMVWSETVLWIMN